MSAAHMSNDGLYLSISTALGSAASFIVSYETANAIAWFVGVCAGVVSIMAGVLTIREKLLAERKRKGQDGQ
jgi:uncharacterized membrane protein HdeD (DUF308 family)